jgi:hypothetical protein
MLPYVAIFLAFIFLVLKASGLLDEFTDRMRRIREREERRTPELREPLKREESVENRLEVFREFLDERVDDDEGS